jgi:hypothetical protein
MATAAISPINEALPPKIAAISPALGQAESHSQKAVFSVDITAEKAAFAAGVTGSCVDTDPLSSRVKDFLTSWREHGRDESLCEANSPI